MTPNNWTYHPAPPGFEVIETKDMGRGQLGHRLSALVGWGFVDGSVWPLTLSSDLDNDDTNHFCVRFPDGHVESQEGERWDSVDDFLEARQAEMRAKRKSATK